MKNRLKKPVSMGLSFLVLGSALCIGVNAEQNEMVEPAQAQIESRQIQADSNSTICLGETNTGIEKIYMG